MVTYSDPDAATKAALSELSVQSDRLLPTEWASLQLARRHVFEHLMINHGEAYVADGADQYATMDAAEDRAAEFLIRAFATGAIPTRGVEHTKDSSMSFLDPLPFVWWRRAISSNAPNVHYNDGLPFHMVLWPANRIIRVKAQEGPLASVTDVEVDLQRLTALVKPVAADHPSTLALRAKRETGAAFAWLCLEVARRKESGDPHGRDALVIALREKHPGMSKRLAVETIEKLPVELRARRGRRSVKSGPK